MRFARPISLALAFAASSSFAQNILSSSPTTIELSAPVDGPVTALAQIGIGGGPMGGGAAVKFKYTGVAPANTARPTPPDFIVVTPSSGTTPAHVLIGLNENVVRSMPSGFYDLFAIFSTVDQSPPSQTAVIVSLRRLGPPTPAITSVVNNASYQTAISPGTIVSISGSNLGPELGPTPYDDTGSYPTALVEGEVRLFGLTSLTFGGITAPLLYSSPSRLDAIVPSDLGGQGTTDVVIARYGRSSVPLTVPLQDTSPGIYTTDQTGTGQGAISNLVLGGGVITVPILKSTPNSPSNPAPKGSAISLLATGFGPWDPPVPDGLVSLGAGPLAHPPTPRVCGFLPLCRIPVAPVSLTIGGRPATILYVGPASYKPWSILEIAAFVPDDVDSGPQPLVLTIGNNDNSQQNVTVAIQ